MRKLYLLGWDLVVAGCFIVVITSSCDVEKLVGGHTRTCDGEVRSREEITKIANERLDRFCLIQGIDKEEFENAPTMTFEEKQKLWVVDYENTKHFVRFTIDNCGLIETSFGPSGRVTKIESEDSATFPKQ